MKIRQELEYSKQHRRNDLKLIFASRQTNLTIFADVAGDNHGCIDAHTSCRNVNSMNHITVTNRPIKSCNRSCHGILT